MVPSPQRYVLTCLFSGLLLPLYCIGISLVLSSYFPSECVSSPTAAQSSAMNVGWTFLATSMLLTPALLLLVALPEHLHHCIDLGPKFPLVAVTPSLFISLVLLSIATAELKLAGCYDYPLNLVVITCLAGHWTLTAFWAIASFLIYGARLKVANSHQPIYVNV